jgi:HSP20 family protein
MALNPFFGYDPFVPRGYNDVSSITPFVRDLLADTPTQRGFDIREENGKYHISVDVPGVKASDLKVEVEHDSNILHISGGRKTTKGGTVSETRFDKRFTIGDNVDIEKLSANLEDGVLHLVAPKVEQQRPKTRTIQVSEGNKMLEAEATE